MVIYMMYTNVTPQTTSTTDYAVIRNLRKHAGRNIRQRRFYSKAFRISGPSGFLNSEYWVAYCTP
jgi:hypothetical protein